MDEAQRANLDQSTRIALLEAQARALKEAQDKCVTKTEFWPVKAIAYGIAASVLAVVMGALLRLVIVGVGA